MRIDSTELQLFCSGSFSAKPILRGSRAFIRVAIDWSRWKGYLNFVIEKRNEEPRNPISIYLKLQAYTYTTLRSSFLRHYFREAKPTGYTLNRAEMEKQFIIIRSMT